MTYLVRYFRAADEPLNAINLNILNLAFLMLGFILHGAGADDACLSGRHAGGVGRDSAVSLLWIVASYDLGEALANLVQPFWMLPILGVFKLGARDVMDYTMVVSRAHAGRADPRHRARPDAVVSVAGRLKAISSAGCSSPPIATTMNWRPLYR